MKERKTISKFFDEIATDTGMVCYGIEDTMKLIDSKSIAKVILFEDLPHYRVKLLNPKTSEFLYKYITPQKL